MRVARNVARAVRLAVVVALALATHPSPLRRPVPWSRSRAVVRRRVLGGAGAPVRLVLLADPCRLVAQRPLLSHQLLHELALLGRLRSHTHTPMHTHRTDSLTCRQCVAYARVRTRLYIYRQGLVVL